MLSDFVSSVLIPPMPGHKMGMGKEDDAAHTEGSAGAVVIGRKIYTIGGTTSFPSLFGSQ